jgi:hypothetical protein
MAGLPGWQASVLSSQTDILIAAQMLGHAHAQVTVRQDAAERAAALEQGLLQADNPVQLGKNLPKREMRGRRREAPPLVTPRKYRENEGRTQRDSNPRHLVPKKQFRQIWP